MLLFVSLKVHQKRSFPRLCSCLVQGAYSHFDHDKVRCETEFQVSLFLFAVGLAGLKQKLDENHLSAYCLLHTRLSRFPAAPPGLLHYSGLFLLSH